MIDRLYNIGASAGSRKCWKLFSTPMTIPLTPKMTVLISIQRTSSAVSACCAGGEAGREDWCAPASGEAAPGTAASAVSRMSTRLTVALKSRHRR